MPKKPTPIRSKSKTPKKQRIILDSPLADGIIDLSSRNKFKEIYSSAKPYPYIVLNSLCQDDRMRKICDEVII